MAKAATVPSTLWGVLIIALFFCALVFIPNISKKTNFSFSPPMENDARLNFPLDLQLNIVKKGQAFSVSSKKVSLGELLRENHRTLLVNFWATWCPPCLEELPSLEFLNRELNGKKDSSLPLLVTISVDEHMEDVSRLYKTLDFSPSFLVLFDMEGELARSVGTVKFPETYWIDQQGKILQKWIGPQAWLSRDVIEKLTVPQHP